MNAIATTTLLVSLAFMGVIAAASIHNETVRRHYRRFRRNIEGEQ
jgi:hypothetical protein